MNRPARAMDSQSARATLPPCSFLPRQFQTPRSPMPAEAGRDGASALRMPSVIHSGIDGSPS